jgi:CRP-like cAMP-binding protein
VDKKVSRVRNFGPRSALAQPVIDEMSLYTSLSDTELAKVTRLGARPVRHAPHASLTTQDGLLEPLFVLSGWALRTRLLRDGRRQVLSFLLPGDFVGELPAGCMVAATTETTTASAGAFLQDVKDSGPSTHGIAKAMKAAADLERDWLLERIVRLGKLSARARLGHLFLELHHRLNRIGLAPQGEFRLPVTQDILSENVGISMVHANRSLQQMRRDGLIDLKGGRLRLLDRRRLELLCEFTPPDESDLGGSR